MSKPALGRGLGSLLKSEPAPTIESSSDAPPNGGVNLLLHGRDGESELAPSITALNPWLVPSLLGADAVLVIDGLVLFLSQSPAAKVIAGVLLVLVGGSLGIVATVLGSRSSTRRESVSPNRSSPARGPSPRQEQKVRVRFVDEMPKQRKN